MDIDTAQTEIDNAEMAVVSSSENSEAHDPSSLQKTEDSSEQKELTLEGAEGNPAVEDTADDKQAAKVMEIEVSAPVAVDCQEDLDLVVSRHQEWIASVLNPRSKINGSRANFRGGDLSGLSLAKIDMRSANFSKCNLIGTDFSGANLSGANFIHADLQGAILNGARLRRANFQFADLREVELQDTNLDDALFVSRATKEAAAGCEENLDPSDASLSSTEADPSMPATNEAEADLRSSDVEQDSETIDEAEVKLGSSDIEPSTSTTAAVTNDGQGLVAKEILPNEESKVVRRAGATSIDAE